MKIVPAKKLQGRVSRVLKAEGNSFVSKDVEKLELTYGGIKGDFHEGLTRNSGGREPWYKRGTEMRNERHLSILSEEELADIAPAMGLDVVDAGWIGANLVFEGIAKLSYLPPRTLIMFEHGVTLRIDGYNAPCRFAGGSIAEHVGVEAEDHKNTDVALNFTKAAHMKRGLVAWVEREGEIRAGDSFTARIWEQWIYE
ncbi:MAG: MOSC domain-containing protein [Pseudomonadota bacterium]